MRIGDILISQERDKQIIVNEFTIDKDVEYYTEGQLKDMAMYVLMNEDDAEKDNMYTYLQSKDIGTWFLDRAKEYSYTERLTVAGALLAAEIDRIETSKIKN